MELLLDRPDLGVRVGVTDAADGDVHPTRVDDELLASRQLGLTRCRWAMAAQVHGTATWQVDRVRRPDELVPADIVVLERPESERSPAALAMWAADCATAVFVTERALIGVHAGWRGLAAGVIQQAVSASGLVDSVVIGPLIGPCCYEFSERDLATVAGGVGAGLDAISGVTAHGSLALDVGAAVGAALADAGLAPDVVAPTCTGCTGCGEGGRPRFSHRARVDVERHALVGWFA